MFETIVSGIYSKLASALVLTGLLIFSAFAGNDVFIQEVSSASLLSESPSIIDEKDQLIARDSKTDPKRLIARDSKTDPKRLIARDSKTDPKRLIARDSKTDPKRLMS